MSERRRTPSCWSLRLFDLTRPCLFGKVASCESSFLCLRGGRIANPGVVEFGLDADHFAFFLELGAQDA